MNIVTPICLTIVSLGCLALAAYRPDLAITATVVQIVGTIVAYLARSPLQQKP
jgi:multisubunit Na+/H+ antiporter MnhB subunit